MREVVLIGIQNDVDGEWVCDIVVAKPDRQLNEAVLIDLFTERLVRYNNPKRLFS